MYSNKEMKIKNFPESFVVTQINDTILSNAEASPYCQSANIRIELSTAFRIHLIIIKGLSQTQYI